VHACDAVAARLVLRSYFEVNYAGANASFLDEVFGTFCASFREGDKEGAKQRADAKSSLTTPPTAEFVTYLASSALCLLLWAYQALAYAHGGPALSSEAALALGVVAGFGPVLLAYAVSALFKGSGGSGSQSALNTAIQLGVGTVFCSVPVAWACYLTLQAPMA